MSLTNLLGGFSDIHELAVLLSALLVLVLIFNDPLNMSGIGLWISDNLIIYLLVASLAQSSRMMRPVLVLALSGLFLVALSQVAVMAHELGLVAPVIMVARADALETLENALVVQDRLILSRDADLTLRVNELLNKLLFPRRNRVRLSALLHLPFLNLGLLLLALRLRACPLLRSIIRRGIVCLVVLLDQSADGLDVVSLCHVFGVHLFII